ncbi:MAG TPA: trypsin-like peptidase domain-containing protein [Thermaerobacter sp.]
MIQPFAWERMVVDALEHVRPVLVHVAGTDRERQQTAYGTGFVFDHWHVIANAQTVDNAAEVVVTLQDGTKCDAEVVGTDPVYFIAVLRLAERFDGELPRWRPTRELQVGQFVVAVGFPLNFQLNASFGIINTVDMTLYRPDRIPVDGLIVTQAPMHPGNTGGPLVLLDGSIAGMNGIPWSHGLSLAVQGDVVRRVVNQIIEFGRATHPWLGFSGQPEVVDRAIAQLFALPVDRGLVVGHVAENGPGRRAGIKPFDMVVRADDHPVTNTGAIRKVLAYRRPGERARLTVLRGGELIELEFPVEEIPRLASPS